MSKLRWLAEHREDGVLNGRIGRAGDDLVAEWTGVARLEVRVDGTKVRFSPDPSADPVDVEKVRRGSARALLRHLDGALALHGSAVAVGGRAVGLFGDADAGKSTLAASLCLGATGGVLLADDTIALEMSEERFEVLSLEENHWLDAGSRAALGLGTDGDQKHPVRARCAVGNEPLVLLAHLVFAPVDAPRITVLSGVEAIAAVLPRVLRFIIDEPERQRKELETLAELVRLVPIVRLERPRRYDQLETTATMIAALSHPRSP